MSDAPRTPREAKQQFLNDLIGLYRTTTVQVGVNDPPHEVLRKCTLYNVDLIRRLAEKHGLAIPPKKNE